MKKIIPVLHLSNDYNLRKNLELLLKYDFNKVFIIEHGNSEYKSIDKIFGTINIAKNYGFWVGSNFLGENVANIISSGITSEFNALWYDNSFAGINNIRTKEIFEKRNEINPSLELFGGVAFKYCEQPKNLKEACDIASEYMDVIVSSGSGTGIAADITKISNIVSFVDSRRKVGIASGITPENINDYNVDIVMVSTGISSDFFNFDETKIKKIISSYNI